MKLLIERQAAPDSTDTVQQVWTAFARIEGPKYIRRKPRTWSTFEARIRPVLVSLGDRIAGTLTPSDAIAHVEGRTRTPSARGNGNVSRYSAEQEIALLRLMLRWFRRERKISKDPLDGWRREAGPGKRTTVFTPAEVAAVIRHADGDEMRAVILGVLDCGLRPTEIRSNEWTNVDFQRGRFTVPAALSKNKKARTVVCSDRFLDALRMISRERPNGTTKVWIWESVRRRTPAAAIHSTSHKAWKRTCRRAGIDWRTHALYSLRHTGAVRLAEAGGTIMELRDHLGHSTLEQPGSYLPVQESTLLSARAKLDGRRAPHRIDPSAADAERIATPKKA